MQNSSSRHLAGCIVLSLILLTVAGMQPGEEVADTTDSYKYQKDTLYCAISLPNRNGVQEGKGVGLSYEMLKYFGDFTSSYVSIVPGSCDVSYLDTLSGGKLDILVLAYPDDMIPEEDEDKYLVSRLVRNNIHWVTDSLDINLLLCACLQQLSGKITAQEILARIEASCFVCIESCRLLQRFHRLSQKLQILLQFCKIT